MNMPFGFNSDQEKVAFDRAELGLILSVYGRMVAPASGAITACPFLREVAVFSVFRRAAEHPIYRIQRPGCARHRGNMR